MPTPVYSLEVKVLASARSSSRGVVCAGNAALRYGRQYFRPVSDDQKTFGFSSFAPGVLAFTRHPDRERDGHRSEHRCGIRHGGLGFSRRHPQPGRSNFHHSLFERGNEGNLHRRADPKRSGD